MTANAKSTLYGALAGCAVTLACLGASVAAQAAESLSIWATLPSAADMAAVYPRKARESGLAGAAVMTCQLADDQTLRACTVEQEDPGDFGAAALSLAPRFRMKAPGVDGAPAPGVRLRIPVRFALPEPPLREVRFPRRPPREYERFGPIGGYYPEAAARRGITGAALIECAVGPGGALNRCKVLGERPENEDFGSAAMRMAMKGWIVAAPKPDGEAYGEEEVGRFLVRFPGNR